MLAGENVAEAFVRRAVAAVADLVVFVRRSPLGRRVEEIVAVPSQLESGVFTTELLWAPGREPARRNGAVPEAVEGRR